MFYRISLRKFLPLFSVTLALFTFVACSEDEDNPAGEDTDHAEAFGCVLILESDTLAVTDTSAVNGALNASVGDTLGPIEVWFKNEDGELFRPADEAGPLDHSAHELDIRLTEPQFASALLGHEQSEELEWAFFLIGQAAGSTSLRVVILHEGHDDFSSALIPLVVAP